jgi:hypothetical protein
VANWVRIDVGLQRNSKVLRLTSTGKHRAAWLYVGCILHCGEHATGGYVDPVVVPMLGGKPADIKALIEVGLLHEAADQVGYVIHDWDDYQPSVDIARARSEQAAKAARARWNR